MANDVYGRRKMYTGGGFLIFIIPIGAILIFFLYDFIMNMYTQNTLNSNSQKILLQVLDREGLETEEQYKQYALRVIEDFGYDSEEASFIIDNDKFYLSIYDRYTSVVGTLSFGIIKNKEIMVMSSYVGYYNKYKEAVVEKYVEENTLEDFVYEDDEDDYILE